MVAGTDNVSVEREWSCDTGPAPGLPPRLRLLCISPTEPSWVNLTLQLDAQDCHEPQFRWVSTSQEALTLLRGESFDCVLIADVRDENDKSLPEHALALLRAIRASGCDDPIVLVTPGIPDNAWDLIYDKNCELLVTPSQWESVALVPVIKHAVSRVELLRENHRLSISNHRRLVRERDEAEHLLRQQRQIVQELEDLARTAFPQALHEHHEQKTPSDALETPESSTADLGNDDLFAKAQSPRFHVPEEINDYYDELLRTYVIMGSGSLGPEIAKLAELLSVASLSPRETLELHLERVESLVRGLGNRSTRHVMARADLLALELMIHLGECYQKLLPAQRPSNDTRRIDDGEI
jgi:hypothetical protein